MQTRKLTHVKGRKRLKRVAELTNKLATGRLIIPDFNVPPDNLTDYVIAIYGAKGIGKTSLTAQFPNALTMMWEPRRRNLKIRQIPDYVSNPRAAALDWETYKRYQSKIIESTDDNVKTIVSDTIDRAYEACFAHVCSEAGCSHPNEMNDFGQTWKAITIEFESTFNALLNSHISGVFVSHKKMHVIPNPHGDDLEQIGPSCGDKAFDYLKAVVDFAFYFDYVGEHRVLTVQGNSAVWASSQVDDHFLDSKTGKRIRQINMGTSAAFGYKQLTRAFNNELEDYDRTGLEEKKSKPIRRKT